MRWMPYSASCYRESVAKCDPKSVYGACNIMC
eukprot:COSAG06_NODE_41269_length_393_cov_0.707483_1_plen_31_part_01